MKIKILTLAAGLEEILSSKLNDIGLDANTVDYTKPLANQIKDAEVLVNGLGVVDKLIIDACPKLKMIHQIGIGVDNTDIPYCTSKYIYVANVPKNNSVSVAEHTLYLMIYLAKNMNVAIGGLMKRRVLNVMGSELRGKTILIIGLGYTGIEVAKLAKAFGMKAIGITKNLSKHSGEKKYFEKLADLQSISELLPITDYVSIHTPLTDETKKMIGIKEFNLMKKSAFLVNVARAAIVDKEALYDALKSGKIAGAAFDVFWEEPADPNDELLRLDNFVLTPHIAGWSAESVEATAKLIANNIQLVSSGKVPLTLVNTESIKPRKVKLE